MAKCRVEYPESFGVSLEKIGANINQVCDEALKAGGEVAENIVRSNLEAAIGNTKTESRSTGELVESLGVSPVKTDKNGIINVKVGFSEPRRKQSSPKGKRSYYEATNAMIANVLEYGKHGQPARPFMAKSKRQAKRPIEETMSNVIDRELKKYT